MQKEGDTEPPSCGNSRAASETICNRCVTLVLALHCGMSEPGCQVPIVVLMTCKEDSMSHIDKRKYPPAWKKISALIRRLAQDTCEWCHEPCATLSVHHIGAPRATGRGWKHGDPSDKHDVRRENLAALCWRCHRAADQPLYEKWKAGQAKRQAKREQHAALGIGTGLICVSVESSDMQRSASQC